MFCDFSNHCGLRNSLLGLEIALTLLPVCSLVSKPARRYVTQSLAHDMLHVEIV